MKTAILDALIHLFGNAHEDVHNDPDLDNFISVLSEAGLNLDQLYSVYDKLIDMELLDPLNNEIQPSKTAIRYYTNEEKIRIDLNGRRFLQFLEQLDVLSPHQREQIIEQATEVQSGTLALDDLKWITLTILTDEEENNKQSIWLKHLLFHPREYASLH